MIQVLGRDLTAIILTFNEENNIERVLDRLYWLEKIIVVDSFSTDRTIQILKQHPNVSINYRKFDSFAGQCNHALTLCDANWILSLDADYILPDTFSNEVQSLIAQPDSDKVAYFCKFCFLVFGKHLLSDNTTPRAVLFKPSYCQYYDDGHAHRLKINGPAGKFSQRIWHDDRKSLSRWIDSQSTYSMKEADKLVNTLRSELSFTSKIRKTKVLAPFLVFFYCLFIQGLILNGWRGWHYTLQRTMVEILFALRLMEKDLTKETGALDN